MNSVMRRCSRSSGVSGSTSMAPETRFGGSKKASPPHPECGLAPSPCSGTKSRPPQAATPINASRRFAPAYARANSNATIAHLLTPVPCSDLGFGTLLLGLADRGSTVESSTGTSSAAALQRALWYSEIFNTVNHFWHFCTVQGVAAKRTDLAASGAERRLKLGLLSEASRTGQGLVSWADSTRADPLSFEGQAEPLARLCPCPRVSRLRPGPRREWPRGGWIQRGSRAGGSSVRRCRGCGRRRCRRAGRGCGGFHGLFLFSRLFLLLGGFLCCRLFFTRFF